MNKVDIAKEDLRKIGYSETQLEELMTIATEEIRDEMFEMLGEKTTDQEIYAFECRAHDAKAPQEAELLLREMAKKAFGEEADEKIEGMLYDFLQDTVKVTMNIREMNAAYQRGDPDVRKRVEEAMKSPELKKRAARMNPSV